MKREEAAFSDYIVLPGITTHANKQNVSLYLGLEERIKFQFAQLKQSAQE